MGGGDTGRGAGALLAAPAAGVAAGADGPGVASPCLSSSTALSLSCISIMLSTKKSTLAVSESVLAGGGDLGVLGAAGSLGGEAKAGVATTLGALGRPAAFLGLATAGALAAAFLIGLAAGATGVPCLFLTMLRLWVQICASYPGKVLVSYIALLISTHTKACIARMMHTNLNTSPNHKELPVTLW